MINSLSKTITDKLISNNSITKDDYELYIYGLFMLISQLIYLVITVVFSLIFSCVLQSIVFYISFQFIRKFAGGYHASTELRCEILSTLSILFCIIIIKLSKVYNFQIILLFFSVVATVCICCLCPIDTPEKPLSDKEYKYFRKISWIVLSVIFTIIIITYIFSWNYLFTPCCLSLILEGVLILVGEVKKANFEKNLIY